MLQDDKELFLYFKLYFTAPDTVPHVNVAPLAVMDEKESPVAMPHVEEITGA